MADLYRRRDPEGWSAVLLRDGDSGVVVRTAANAGICAGRGWVTAPSTATAPGGRVGSVIESMNAGFTPLSLQGQLV
jgi:hypothetical protein